MSTRHATDSSAPAFERYMSAPQFAERRGIAGNLVAEKAQLYDLAPYREMLFFLQAESLKRGGFRALADRIVAEFPHLLGSATMHRLGMKPGTRYNEEAMGKIGVELNLSAYEHFRSCDGLDDALKALRSEAENPGRATAAKIQDKNSVEYLADACRFKASGAEAQLAARHRTSRTPEPSLQLAELLEELCINPALDLRELEAGGCIEGGGYVARLWTILAALRTQTEERDSVPGVTTSLGEKLHETLDYALRTGRMVIVEGLAGSGKTTAAESWVRRHPGQARFVSLSGITHRTGFFQKIGAAIGLATCQRKSCELQAKIEAFFQTSGLMLVIDEAHHAWPKGRRVSAAPEIIDWINTALVNAGAPVALICTDQFTRLKAQVEKATGWTSEQLMHRVKRYTKLPERPAAADLRAVAELLLTAAWSEAQRRWIIGEVDADGKAVRAVVAYATLRAELQLAAVRDAIDEARELARDAGRERVTLADAVRAIEDRKAPSDLALAHAFATPADRSPKPKRASARSHAFVTGARETAPAVPAEPSIPHTREVRPAGEPELSSH
ncbi:MAG: ATP-binding protein [Chthoniobacteraceae bacterium]